MHLTLAALCLVLLSFHSLRAQETMLERSFSVSVSAGTALLPTDAVVEHFGNITRATAKPGIAVFMGIEYGPILEVEGARFLVSTEFGYTRGETEVTPQGNHTMQSYDQHVPLMLWAKITTGSALSPFVRAGIGGIHATIGANYFPEDLKELRASYWALGVGLGAGLDWKMTRHAGISFAVNWRSAEGSHTIRNGVYLYSQPRRSVLLAYELRFAYTI